MPTPAYAKGGFAIGLNASKVDTGAAAAGAAGAAGAAW